MRIMTTYRIREISPLLAKGIQQFPVIIISGLRQTGKSTLLQSDPALGGGRSYRTLDDWNTLEQAHSSPQHLLESASALALDEVQRAPELFLPLKRAVDQVRQPGRFVLTGSANLLLLKQVADSLAGRAVYVQLHPFNRRELLGRVGEAPAIAQFLASGQWPKLDVPEVSETEMLRGGFPEVALNPTLDSTLWFAGFERTYLERDVRDLRRVENLPSFRRLVRLSALRMGGILNVSSLGRDAHLPESTTRTYLDLLETLMVIHRLPPFLGNRSLRLVKAPKLYFADSGLAAFLSGVTDISSGSTESMRGAILENYVFQNLLATLEPQMPGVNFSYWNEQGRHEVDFVLEYRRQVLAIEVKAASRLSQNDCRSLEAFLAITPNCAAGIIAYLGKDLLQIGKKVWVVPVHHLLA
jgi:predicted AAA+ superfamily ATPase